MFYKPGFVLRKITLGIGDAEVTVEGSGDGVWKVTIGLEDHQLKAFARTAPEALKQTAARFARIAKSLEELSEVIDK